MLFNQHLSLSVALIYIFFFPLPILNFMQPKPSYTSPNSTFPVHFFLFGMWYNTEMFRVHVFWKSINYFIFSERIYKEGELFIYHYLQENLCILSSSKRSHKRSIIVHLHTMLQLRFSTALIHKNLKVCWKMVMQPKQMSQKDPS